MSAITIIGNLVADPELRFTPSGDAVANITVASTPRKLNSKTQEWEDGETTYLDCSIWRDYAEHVAESLCKGDRVVVIGKLRSANYTTKEGETRYRFAVDADEIAPSLRFATAEVAKSKNGKSQAQKSSRRNR